MLLVTNQLQYAPEADSVLYLEEGEMVACGKYEEVVQNEGFASLLDEYEVRCKHTQLTATCTTGQDMVAQYLCSPSACEAISRAV